MNNDGTALVLTSISLSSLYAAINVILSAYRQTGILVPTPNSLLPSHHLTGLSDCHSPGRICLPLRRMLNALCSRALLVRFIYAGYTPAIRDSAVCCYCVLIMPTDHTHRVYFTISAAPSVFTALTIRQPMGPTPEINTRLPCNSPA